MGKHGKTILLAVKIGLGSSVAIIIAQALQLDYAVSAGTVTLLTLMTTKWETVKLSLARLCTFSVTILVALLIFTHIQSVWVCYGLAVTVVVFLSDALGWRATISVNAVVAAHLLTDQNFNLEAIWNELQLVLIGVVLAILLNLFQDNRSHKKKLVAAMRRTEGQLQMILRGLAAYLSGIDVGEGVWDDIAQIDRELQGFVKSAYEYRENTFHSHPEYYISYFEMRARQCQTLRNLHSELNRIRKLPKQAKIISEYLFYLSRYVVEMNVPEKQAARLEELFEEMKTQELPKTREEFENRALLYHILMDIQDFLAYKAEFVKDLDSDQLKRYWNTTPETEPAVK